eukprot:7938936-Pyramimonas_sp.AAC.1
MAAVHAAPPGHAAAQAVMIVTSPRKPCARRRRTYGPRCRRFCLRTRGRLYYLFKYYFYNAYTKNKCRTVVAK